MKYALLGLAFAAALWAGPKPPWEKTQPAGWTRQDAERIIYDSPWAQPGAALFPDPRDHDPIPAAPSWCVEAGMRSTRGVSDGRWDGGVGMNNGAGLPSLHVLVRWDSASVVRLARERLAALGDSAAASAVTPIAYASDDYVISIAGLVPGSPDKTEARLEKRSSSDDGTISAAASAENLLENFMANSYLLLRTGAVLRPHNAQVENQSGVIRLFFRRTTVIQTRDKEVLLVTRYGSLSVKKRFRLNDLAYRGKLEL